MPDVELLAVADPDPQAAAVAVRGRTLQAYTDPAALFRAHEIDLAVVAVPTAAHGPAAIQALEAGANVLVEKPIATDLATAAAIGDAAKKAGKIVTVGHIERFNPAIVEMRRRVAAGEIGMPFQIVARRTGPFPTRVRDVGVIMDLATHDLDAIRFISGSPFASLYAKTAQHLHENHEDLVAILGRLRNGVIATLDVNWLTPRKVRELRVVGEGGMLVADYLRQDLVLAHNGDRGAVFGEGSFVGVSEGEVVQFQLVRKEPLAAELEAFVSAIVSGGDAPVSIDEAVETLRAAEAALASSASGAPVLLEA
jgi:predicted dehydrogenase